MTALQQLGPILLPQPGTDVEAQTARQTDVSETGLLTTDTVDVEQLTNQAGDVSLSGRYRPPYFPEGRVQMFADEFESLIAGSIGPLVLFDQVNSTTTGGQIGFYEIADGTIAPTQPSQPDVQAWSLSLTRVGSRNTHWRAVRTTPINVTTPYSSIAPDGQYLFVPPDARKVQWYDPDTGTITTASQTTTQPTRFSDDSFPAYDTDSGPGSDPVLLYEVPYESDVAAVRVFEAPAGTPKRDPDGIRQWPALFDTSADIQPDSEFVVDTGAFRLRASGEPLPALAAEEWDRSTETFQSVSLGLSSGWSVVDVDVVSIGQHRVVTDIRFGDGSSLYTVRFRARLGADRMTVSRAPRETTAMPSGLETLLGPIHDDSGRVAQPTRDVLSRREVR